MTTLPTLLAFGKDQAGLALTAVFLLCIVAVGISQLVASKIR